MTSDSARTKEAVKIGIAIVIGYYVALQLDWLSSTWVAISIAFISLPTAGQSLQKGALRMGGTLLAFVAGLFFLGLFPQDRWLFVLVLTPYLFFVSYMVQGKNGQYFWFVAGFVTLMIVTAGPGSSEHAFKFAAYRSLETLIGIVIWTLVSVFLWPKTNLDKLRKTTSDLLSVHEQLVRRYRERAFSEESKESESGAAIRSRAEQLMVQLEQTINAAAAESYRIHEVRHLWQRLHRLCVSAVEILDRLDSGFSEMEKEGLKKTLINEEALFHEIEARLEEARRILGGSKPERSSVDIVIGVDAERMQRLDHFERAAVEVTRSELERLDELFKGVSDCIRDIEGYQPEHSKPVEKADGNWGRGPFGLPSLDPDRVRGAVMVTMSMWLSFLIWIYVNPPGHLSWFQFVPNLALVCIQVPFLRPAFLKPFGFAYLVGMLAYVFVMPQLSTFWQLGLLLFTFSFVAAYFFKGSGRPAIFLSMFTMLGIQNQQVYDFAAMANTFLFTMLALLVLVALSYITRSPRPDKQFTSLLGRFFRSCEFLLSRMAGEHQGKSGRFEQMRQAFHQQEVKTLPGKMRPWGRQVSAQKIPGASAEQVDNLISTLKILAYRMEDLIEVRQAPNAEILVQELTEDVRAWRLVIEEQCHRWSDRPEDGSAPELSEKLKTRLSRLNARIEKVLNSAAPDSITEQESGNFYRLLAGYRGFSDAALVYVGAADEIDWKQLREERF